MPRRCHCGRELRTDEPVGPVTSIAAIKFYRDTYQFGRPSSRRKQVYFCEQHTREFIEFLRSIEGTAADGVPREEGS